MVECRISEFSGVMANDTILIGRQVIREFTHTDPVVVAEVAAVTRKNSSGMIECACAKSPQCMAIATILVTGRTRIVRTGWHVRI